MATTSEAVHVRGSEVERSPQLALSPASWTEFVSFAAGS
ncbi:DUF397 domain-containing protein [Streptomyces sp. GC420]|nr:DUF397 domain-containing protein [Streptomyces sp. GC420]NBM15819.1 DUF397 domain-containing protein [Streptomyces sp. GC420]